MTCHLCLRLSPRHRLGCPDGRTHEGPVCRDCHFSHGTHHTTCPHSSDLFPLLDLTPKETTS